MRVLLTNDDGIYAPGLAAVRSALCDWADETTVVAPQTEQSGVGLTVTYRQPLMYREEYHGAAGTPDGGSDELFGYAVGGSPADCVKMGILEFCGERPDLVVSGINSGANIGINVLYSGTVAGAIEGAFFGVPSIAVSLSQGGRPDYRAAAADAVRVIAQLVERGLPPGALWNLNLPDSSPEGPKGVKVVRMGAKRTFETLDKRTDPRGGSYFWSGVEPIANHQSELGTDIHHLREGYATLTPLRFDLTDDAGYESARESLADLAIER